ncbi:MAG: radical SAM protein [Deltaproteobacteria bacterium]|nr:radical SAM protein [Deltaproteobacteria bacterium]
MEVLVVSVNRLTEPVPVLPLGACAAAEAAERAGHRVRLLDLLSEGDPLGRLRAKLSRRRADVVGLSVRNLDNAEWSAPASYVPAAAQAVAAAKAAGARVVLGGAGVGVMAEALLARTGADAAVAGDGEDAFPAVLEALDSGGADPGAAVWRRPYSGPWRFPRLERWLDLKAYASRFAAVPVQTKRGCPFSCVYCTYPGIEGRDYRLCPPAEAAAEVERLGKVGARDVEFVDNLFNAPRDHALEVCEEVARRRPGLRLHSVDLSPLTLDDELLGAMEAAGFAGAGVTAESASDPVLERLGKGFGAADVHRAAEGLRRRRIPTMWVFLLGGPGETRATVAETLRFAETSLGPSDAAFFNVGVRVYPGTALEGIARDEGVLDGTEDLLDPTFYLSPALDPEWLLRTVNRAVGGNPRFLGPSMPLRWLLPLVRRVGYAAGLRPPLWRHSGRLRRLVTLPRRPT